MTDTIFALSSGRPPAAISVIRISGPHAHEAGARIAGHLPDPRLAAVRALHHPRSGELLDEALVLRFDSPASSTGEDMVELHCHGGRAVVDAVLAALSIVEGLREAEPGEFTRRAFANGRIDLTQAEGLADLIEAETETQRKAALTLAEGGLRKQIAAWQGRLLDLSAAVERAIDYDEEDQGIDNAVLEGCSGLAVELRDWLARPRVEPLKAGVAVVVAGEPNVGKSSLINAILGEERVIVSDVPGTTRDYVEIPLSIGGMPIRLTDTAGLRESDDPIEIIGVELSERLVRSADVLLWLGRPASAPDHPRVVLVRSKADLPAPPQQHHGALAVSAVTGQGLAELLESIERQVRGMLPAEDAIALNRRQADLLEQAFVALSEVGSSSELVLIAENLRLARTAFDRLTGSAGIEEVLDALFSRFCLGK